MALRIEYLRRSIDKACYTPPKPLRTLTGILQVLMCSDSNLVKGRSCGSLVQASSLLTPDYSLYANSEKVHYHYARKLKPRGRRMLNVQLLRHTLEKGALI